MSVILPPAVSNDLSNLISVLADPKASIKLAQQFDELNAQRQALNMAQDRLNSDIKSHLMSVESDKLSIAKQMEDLVKTKDKLQLFEKRLEDREASIVSREVNTSVKEHHLQEITEQQDAKSAELSDLDKHLNSQLQIYRASENAHRQAKSDIEKKLKQLQEIING